MLLQQNRGFTIIELLIGLFIGGLLIAAFTLFIARSVSVNRFQTEQIRTTEDGRLTLNKVSDIIRNATALDCNDHWLLTAENYQIIITANADSDAEIERVRYTLTPNSTDLVVGITDPTPGQPCNFPPGQEQVNTLARSVLNTSESQPLFRYYATGNADEAPLPAPPSNLNNINRIGITLRINAATTQNPGTSEVATEVVPRINVDTFTVPSIPPSPTPSLSPTPTPTPSPPPNPCPTPTPTPSPTSSSTFSPSPTGSSSPSPSSSPSTTPCPSPSPSPSPPLSPSLPPSPPPPSDPPPPLRASLDLYIQGQQADSNDSDRAVILPAGTHSATLVWESTRATNCTIINDHTFYDWHNIGTNARPPQGAQTVSLLNVRSNAGSIDPAIPQRLYRMQCARTDGDPSTLIDEVIVQVPAAGVPTVDIVAYSTTAGSFPPDGANTTVTVPPGNSGIEIQWYSQNVNGISPNPLATGNPCEAVYPDAWPIQSTPNGRTAFGNYTSNSVNEQLFQLDPNQTTYIFRIRCYNAAGQYGEDSVTVIVDDNVAINPVINSFTANNTAQHFHSTSCSISNPPSHTHILSWSASNATSCRIVDSQGLDVVVAPPTGSYTTPETTQSGLDPINYMLTCSNISTGGSVATQACSVYYAGCSNDCIQL